MVRLENFYLNQLELESLPHKVLAGVRKELNDNTISQDELDAYPIELMDGFSRIIEETAELENFSLNDLSQIKENSPQLYKQVGFDADKKSMDVEIFVQEINPHQYLSNLIIACQQKIKMAKRREIVSSVAEMIKNRKTILKTDVQEIFSRYSITLENSFFKTMKEYRLQKEYTSKKMNFWHKWLCFSKFYN